MNESISSGLAETVVKAWAMLSQEQKEWVAAQIGREVIDAYEAPALRELAMLDMADLRFDELTSLSS